MKELSIEETPESCNEFLEKQGSKKETLKERNICYTCEDSNGCLIPCCAKLLEKQGEQKPAAWSEEDEKMFELVLDMIEWYSGKNEDKSRLVSGWLKSLKDRVQH